MERYGRVVTVFVGLGKDEYLRRYFRRELERLGFILTMEISQKVFSSTILDLIEHLSSKNLLIVVENDDLVSTLELFSTVFNETSTLASGEGEIYVEESYLFRYRDVSINILSVKDGNLPKILLKAPEVKEIKRYIFFCEDENIETHLKSLLKSDSTIYINFIYPYSAEIKLAYNKSTTLNPEIYLRKSGCRVVERDSLVEAIIEYIDSKGKKITFAESCTGGALVNRFISYPNASRVIDGSFITYSNSMKESLLGVNRETIKRFGAVSRESVIEMAKGAKRKVGSNISIAVSGIAGPTGAVENKPVGTVYICIDYEGGNIVKRLNLKGDRVHIQTETVNWAIYLLVKSQRDFFDFFTKSS
jgi:nicotinamide-nucleotide amidase